MFEYIENLKLLEIIQNESVEERVVTDRFSHTFVFKVNGESEYVFGNKKIILKPDEMIFIPKGSTYTVQKITKGKSIYTMINFSGNIPKATPEKYSMKSFSDLPFLCKYRSDDKFFSTPYDKYKKVSVFYGIISYLLEAEGNTYLSKNKKTAIMPCEEYLRTHIHDPNLNVEDLCKLCKISNTYFRKIFFSVYGTTPQKYITDKRLSDAYSMLESGKYRKISDIANKVGYNDSLYFSRAFKRKYGISPNKV